MKVDFRERTSPWISLFNLKAIFRKYPSGIYPKVMKNKFEEELRPSNIKVEKEERAPALKVLNKFTKHYLNYHRGSIHQKNL